MFKYFIVSLALAELFSASSASARCKDARKTCDYTRVCASKNPGIVAEIQDAVSKGNGHSVWLQLHKCEDNTVWVDSQSHFNSMHKTREFKDISAGCSDPDLVEVGKWGLQSLADYQHHNGDSQACNQLPE